MSNQTILPLNTDLSRQQAAMEVIHAPFDHVCILKPDNAYLRRQREMWGMLNAISKQVDAPSGAKYTPSQWRAVLIAQWASPELLSCPDEHTDPIEYWRPQDEWPAEAFEEWLTYVAQFARDHNVGQS